MTCLVTLFDRNLKCCYFWSYARNVVNETFFLNILTHCVSLNFTASFILLYGFKVSSRGLTSVSGGLYDCRDFNRASSVGISRGFLFSSVKGFSED